MNFKIPVPLILILGLFLIFSTVGKIYFNAKNELKLAEDFISKDNPEDAVTHYVRSIQWFVPGLNLQEMAAQGLWDVALKYEAQNDSDNALTAYRLLRGAFYSVRSFYTPGKTWILRCNEKIAFLMAKQPATSESEKAKTFEERLAANWKLLTDEKPPRPLWAMLAICGFFGWIGSALLFIMNAMTKSGGVRKRPALVWSLSFLLFYGLWMLGLFNT
jgi:hypothetical protein